MSGQKQTAIPFPRRIPEIKPPVIEHTEINPGIPVTFIMNHALPMVVLELIFHCGIRTEAIAQNGITMLTLNMADEGAGQYTSLELHDKFDYLGSSVHCYGDQDSARIQVTTLRENFAETMALVALLLQQPRFDQKDFDREKHRLLVQLQQSKDVADRIADRVFSRKIFRPGHIYENDPLGSIATLETVGRDDSRNRFNEIINNGAVEVVAAGDIDKASLRDILSASLGAHNTQREKPAIKRDHHPAGISIVHKNGAPQTEIMLGHQAPVVMEGNHLARSAANMILGGQFSSRLNMNLREQHGYTYGVHSYFSSQQLCGEFIISTSVAAKDTAKALEQIFIELDGIKKQVTKRELNFVKASMANRLSLGFETNSHLLFNMIFLRMHDIPEDYFATYIAAVRELDNDIVLQAARDYICPDEMQVVLVGNREEIEQGLHGSSITLPIEVIENNSLW
jgi:zinc protease